MQAGAALLVTAAGWLLLALLYDFYFDLNDDVLMKDLLCGRYTGVPEACNIQMLYPLPLLISGGYRLLGRLGGGLSGLDLYGALLLFLQALSAAVMIFCVLRAASGGQARRVLWKLAACAVFLLPFLAMMLYHLVYVQYTVTCAMLGAAAALLFLTAGLPEPGPCGESGGGALRYSLLFLRRCMPAVLLVWTGYLLRTEMMLLLLPLILLAALLGLMRRAAGWKGSAGRVRVAGGRRAVLH